MSINRQNPVINNFNRAALTYNQAAVVQREIADRLLEKLCYIHLQPQSILDLGAGTGYATRLLAEQYPTAELTALDMSENMLAQISQPDTTLLCADAANIPLDDNSVDLVFSSLMLHWCADIGAVFIEIQRILRPDGLVLFATLGPDTMHELRSAWAKVDDLPHVHHFLDMHDIGDLMLAAKLQNPVMDREDITLQYAAVSSFMRDLKALGVQNTHPKRRRGLMGKQRYAEFVSAYEDFEQNGRMPVTYEVLYGHAWGGQPQDQPQATEVAIPLSAIKRHRVSD